ncbi:flagellar protein FliT [Alkalihalobacillus sp. LMS6]|uniref:flagellar protein FliT n=1 Tax=Bacillaceae TaxID=186817 RepID=UPI000C06E524|nr:MULTISPECIES: flagellar protein FliT [Bacillaceae]UTR05602.1 flagellar protein FliT [Alkalihalobacillus sp. LMS6]
MTTVEKNLAAHTTNLVTHLSNGLPNEDLDRDGYIEELMRLLENRQNVINELIKQDAHEPLNLTEEKRIKELLSTQLEAIKKEMSRFTKQKEGRQRYQQAYGRTQSGVFLDKKTL